jgi:hypothetical protein
MENKQTPVEWYKERLKYRFLNGDTEESIYEQAKEMESALMEELKDFEKWKEWKNKPQ